MAAPPARATDASQQTPAADPGPPSETDDDTTINPGEPDYTIISLPTSLRLPKFKSAFRVTHRFARPLSGDFGGLAADHAPSDFERRLRLEEA